MSNRNFHFTADVDFVHGTEEGLTGLYDFCDARQLKATFFFTGKYALHYPELVKEAVERGFEIGSHGWLHGEDPLEDFSTQSYGEQHYKIARATEEIEKASGCRPRAFRAPNLFVNSDTIRALVANDYLIDSSVPARRADFKPRHNHFAAPLRPYFPDADKIGRPGNGTLCEVPPSAYFVPINMSALRTLGLGAQKWAIRRVLAAGGHISFYSHPAEFTSPEKIKYAYPVPARHLEGVGPQNFGALGEFADFLEAEGCVSAFMQDSIPS